MHKRHKWGKLVRNVDFEMICNNVAASYLIYLILGCPTQVNLTVQKAV